MSNLVIMGTNRPNSTADKVIKLVNSALAKNGQAAQIMDLRNLDLPHYNEAKPPIYAKGDYENKEGVKWSKTVEAAKAIIILSPEYNHSIPSVLKNAIDWAYTGWEAKKIILVTYGVNGGSYVQKHLVDIMEVLHTQKPRIVAVRLDDFNEEGELANPVIQANLNQAIKLGIGSARQAN